MKSKLVGEKWYLGNYSNTRHTFLGQKAEYLEVISICNLIFSDIHRHEKIMSNRLQFHLNHKK